jgi:predicted nucleic-acid-binding protein
MRHPDIPLDDSDLVEEAIYFYKQGQTEIIDYCIKKHPKLKDMFKEVYSTEKD